MLKSVDGKAARPTKSELKQIECVYESFGWALPAKWTPESVRKAKNSADILEGLLSLVYEDKAQRRADAAAEAVRATGLNSSLSNVSD